MQSNQEHSGAAQWKSGHLGLEFTNTVHWHASDHPQETLHTYEDFINWARATGALSEATAGRLLEHARRQPDEAMRALEAALELREALYRIFAAVAHGAAPAESDLVVLNDVLGRMTAGAQIAGTPEGFTWKWRVDEQALDAPVWPIALSAAELLVSGELRRVGQCADDRGCGWLFFDTSKNGSRRWCDINDCGNRAKQRRHRARANPRA